MAKCFIEDTTLTAIGNAIRAKSGKTDLILPGAMATEIAGLHGGIVDLNNLVTTGLYDTGTISPNTNPDFDPIMILCSLNPDGIREFIDWTTEGVCPISFTIDIENNDVSGVFVVQSGGNANINIGSFDYSIKDGGDIVIPDLSESECVFQAECILTYVK